ncbi:hypothetical protein HWX34_17965 [Aquitalea sp. LB_tupeE]|nr:hypothetical protein [Aquitalea sp. LB_tupeE]
MSKTAHVVRRGAVYYYRLRVPADLLEHYGKDEIIFSLKTKDAAEAKLKAADEGLRLQGEFSVLRQAMKANLVSGLTP